MFVEIRHINKIIGNPELFGLTIEKIKKVYDKYNEPLGLEQKPDIKVLWITIKKTSCKPQQNK
jgi:hypothetical protein